jgi:hypothetical protein
MSSILIKRDLRQLSKIIYEDNNINDWTKIIIAYNIYLVFSQIMLIIYYINCFNNIVINSANNVKSTYLFFFLLCSLQNSYAYGILNVNKVNPELASNLHNNMKNYLESFN